MTGLFNLAIAIHLYHGRSFLRRKYKHTTHTNAKAAYQNQSGKQGWVSPVTGLTIWPCFLTLKS